LSAIFNGSTNTWQGRLAEQFGLAGAVSAEDFARLGQGQHPQTGEQLVRQRASYQYQDTDGKTITTMEHRAGWDATFSAPKSVSLTALVGGDERVSGPSISLNIGRSPSTRVTVFENLLPFPATRTSSARQLWMSVR
jgi:hypothetical protein